MAYAVTSVDEITGEETSVEGVAGIKYLSSFERYQIRATSPETLNDIIIAISWLEGEAQGT